MRLAVIAIFTALSGCASAPGLVRAETKCTAEVSITSLTSEFGDGPVTGCAERAYTGRFFLVGTQTEVRPSHLLVDRGVITVAPEYLGEYGLDESQ